MRRVVSVLAGAVLLGSALATQPAAVPASVAAAPRQAAPARAARVAPARVAPTAPAAAVRRRSSTPAPLRWGRCADVWLRRSGVVCGSVRVPLDYAHPHGATIRLAVSKVARKKGAKPQGVMLVNPGGPGSPGLSFAMLGGAVPHHGGDGYDWIGFDPRGVGRSRPLLTCDGGYLAAGRPAYEPTAGTERAWLTRSAAYARRCQARRAALLRHDRTVDWARDMESIRKALRVSKISFYGFSYGTYLGQVYASLHPGRVRRMVFDGVVDPRGVWYAGNLAQERQFDPNIDRFFAWVAAHDGVYGLGTDRRTVRAVYDDTLADLSVHPVAGFGAADWTDVFVSAAYYVYGWDRLAHVLASASRGDLEPARQTYGDPTGPGADNSYATYLAVECTDAPWPGWARQRQDAVRMAATAPFLAWNNTWFNAPCLTWSAPASHPVRVRGAKAPPILLVSETGDAATPWAGALEVRRRFRRSVLIEGVGGTTHAGSLSGVHCTDDRIATYLRTGRLPRRLPGQRSDVRCRPVPTPTATPADGSASRTVAPAADPIADPMGALRRTLRDATTPRT